MLRINVKLNFYLILQLAFLNFVEKFGSKFQNLPGHTFFGYNSATLGQLR